MDDVLELPDIPRPCMSGEERERPLLKRFCLNAGMLFLQCSMIGTISSLRSRSGGR